MSWLTRKAVNVLQVVALLIVGTASFAQSGTKAEPGSTAQECPAAVPQTPRTNLEFGSRAVLDSCWSEQQLKGSPADKKIVKTPAFRKPPERQMPINSLPPLAPMLQNSIRDVAPRDNRKVVAVTFDLCERGNEITGYDAAIINYLRAKQVKATFFASGKWMLDHPEKTMQLMADPLFEIGNHAWTHDDLRVEKGIKMDDQVLWTQAQYELLWEQLRDSPCAQKAGQEEMEKIPKIPGVFRFPYGVCSQASLDFLALNGLPAIQWSIVTADPAEKRTPQEIARAVLKSVKPGAIIICHANGLGHGTAAALPLFIPKLKKMGYEFVTVSELLTYGPAYATKDCYELKPGDNHSYDQIYGKQK